MIDLYPVHSMWDFDNSAQIVQGVTVAEPTGETVSAVLGPDGEPVRITHPRQKIGFDLRPKRRAE